jgi:ribosomal protein S18 acetylase RimI-like enzyme
MDIEIRPITPADHPAIHEVYRQCEDFIALGPIAKASVDMVVADIEEAKAERGVFCGIFYGKKMIGVVSYVPSNFEFRPVDAFILLLMLIPSYRRKGIGGEIVSLVEKDICTTGRVRSILCGVQVNNPDAVRFWEKNGYRIFAGPELRLDKTTVFHLRKDIERGGTTNGRKKIQ